MRDSRTHTFEAATLHSLPVIAVTEGRILGRVKETIFDPEDHALIGVTVSRRDGKPEDFLDVRQARCLGPFAVTTSATANLQKLESHARAHEVVASGVHVRDAPVLTDAGEPIGKIAQIWIRDDGGVAAYVAASGSFLFGRKRRLSPHDVIVIGEDAMIVQTPRAEPVPSDAEPAPVAQHASPRPHIIVAGRDRRDGDGRGSG